VPTQEHPEEGPDASQSSQQSCDSLDGAEDSKVVTLVESFSLLSFYPYQKFIIDAVLDKKDTIVIQSTGNGKSLCFQFPPVYLQKKAIVIMPTISLMRDQTIQVNEHGIKVAYMGSAAKYQQMTTLALDQTSDVNIIFVTPEWLFTERLGNKAKVKALNQINSLALITMDEAHLMYEWHSFRPLYAHCQELPIEFYNDTESNCDSRHHGQAAKFLRSPVIEKGSVYRSNIYLESIHCDFKLWKG